ncbi:MAG: DUF4299 family protein [Solobacterium sp.]|nr:DUF4299 family protein [Solobacterium sp.]
MSTEGMSITVTVTRRSFFPRVVTPKMILLDGMSFGCSREGRFLPGEYGKDTVIAYHNDHIGRGILIRWDDHNIRFTELKLNLPASSEEIDDFFLMSARLARQDLSEVTLNGEPFAPKTYHDVVEKVKVYNLKLLHEMMGNILNEESDMVSIGCVFHRLAAGMKEADRMWAGVSTDVFRDWMHQSQSTDAYFSEARLSSPESEEEQTAVFTLPSNRPVIFPDREELPIRFYDLSTGKPRYQVSDWLVELVDHTQKKVLGNVSFQQLKRFLPQEKVSYFDAADSLIEPLTVEDLSRILEQAEQEHV